MSEPKYKVGDRVRVLPVPILQSKLHGREGVIVHISQTTGPEPLFSIVLDGDEQKACGLRACEIEPAPVHQPPAQSAGPRFKKGDLVQNNMGRKATVLHQDEATPPQHWVRFWDTGQGEWYYEADLFPQDQIGGTTIPTPEDRVRDLITCVCLDLRTMLIEKNKAYGNSALDPVRIFSKADPIEQLNVRIDDKLSRLVRGQDAGEDVELDLLGYLVLKQVAKRLKNEQNAPTE